MTPAPADLSRVLRQHGYERNMVLPEALRRRMAAELTITPSELDGHLQALQDAERSTPLLPKPETPPVQVIDKSLPRKERVLKACEAIGVELFAEFTESDKSLFTEALGIQRKAAMQYLKDTRAECEPVGEAWLKAQGVGTLGQRIKAALANSQQTVTVAETHQNDDPEACEAAEEPDAAPLTTACTEHPTHTATRCEACVIEMAVKTRTETAAQYQAQLNRAVKTMGERGAANRELAGKNLDLAQQLEKAQDALGAEKEASALLKVKTNTLHTVSDEKRRWVEAVTDVHTVLDNAGVTAGVTPAERVQALARQRDNALGALEILHRDNGLLAEFRDAVNAALDAAGISAEMLPEARVAELARQRDAAEVTSDWGYAHQNLDELEAPSHELLSVRIERFGTHYHELTAAHENLMRENAALKEHLEGSGNCSVRPNIARAVTFDAEAKPLPAWYQPGMFAHQASATLNSDERDFAIALLGESGMGSLPMGTRAAVLQLAADMAALAASR